MTTTTAPLASLATTEAGVSRSIYSLVEGDYIWHRGAFLRVTAAEGRTVRMGRHVLHSSCSTVEWCPPSRARREERFREWNAERAS